ncbi:protein polybromo-1-like [Zophobas morio]|uniref:protein polybromo-1-like n=1 Tax=Zophobas morio TaxID=2755281 RepID=UPI003082F2F2
MGPTNRKQSKVKALELLFSYVLKKLEGLKQNRERLCTDFEVLPDKRDYPDYYKVITAPLDLATVRTRLAAGYYKKMKSFWRDLNLIWTNAQFYNEENSAIHRNARILQDFCQKLLRRANKALVKWKKNCRSYINWQEVLESEGVEEASVPSYAPMSVKNEHNSTRTVCHIDGKLPKMAESGVFLSKESALLQLKLLICEMLAVIENENGFRIITPFLTLPNQHDFPDYYEVIQSPIDFNTIREKSVLVDYSMESLIEDVGLLLANARAYNAEGSQIFRESIILHGQFLRFIALFWLPFQPPTQMCNLDFICNEMDHLWKLQEEIKSAKYELTDLETDKTHPLDVVTYKGATYSPGAFVQLVSPRENAPHVVQIQKLWKNMSDNKYYLYGRWFYHPHEIFHSPTRKFYRNEVFKTSFFHTNSFDKVIGPCCVMHVRDYVRYYHKDFPEERKGTALTVFVCELKYEDKNRQLSPIKKWECPEKETHYLSRTAPLVIGRSMPSLQAVSQQSSQKDTNYSSLNEVEKIKKFKASTVQPATNNKRVFYKYYMFRKILYQCGDCVYVHVAPSKTRCIVRIEKIYEADRASWISGCCFVKPQGAMLSEKRTFYEREYLLSSESNCYMMSSISAKCSVLPLSLYEKRRPYGVPEKDVYTYESLYIDIKKQIVKDSFFNENDYILKFGLLEISQQVPLRSYVLSPATEDLANDKELIGKISDDLQRRISDPVFLHRPISKLPHHCRWLSCGLSFSNEIHLLTHVMTTHVMNSRNYTCNWLLCESSHLTCPNANALMDHVKRAHVYTTDWPGSLAPVDRKAYQRFLEATSTTRGASALRRDIYVNDQTLLSELVLQASSRSKSRLGHPTGLETAIQAYPFPETRELMASWKHMDSRTPPEMEESSSLSGVLETPKETFWKEEGVYLSQKYIDYKMSQEAAHEAEPAVNSDTGEGGTHDNTKPAEISELLERLTNSLNYDVMIHMTLLS